MKNISAICWMLAWACMWASFVFQQQTIRTQRSTIAVLQSELAVWRQQARERRALMPADLRANR
jgi:hypothetical protein